MVSLNEIGKESLKAQTENIISYYILDGAEVLNDRVRFLTSSLSDDKVKEETRINGIIEKIDDAIYSIPGHVDMTYGPVETLKVIERKFDPKGLLGAIIGAIGGAIVIALLNFVGYAAAISGLIGGALIMWLYRKLSGYDMPIPVFIPVLIFMVLLGDAFGLGVLLLKN